MAKTKFVPSTGGKGMYKKAGPTAKPAPKPGKIGKAKKG